MFLRYSTYILHVKSIHDGFFNTIQYCVTLFLLYVLGNTAYINAYVCNDIATSVLCT